MHLTIAERKRHTFHKGMQRKSDKQPCYGMHMCFGVRMAATFSVIMSMLYASCQRFEQQLNQKTYQHPYSRFQHRNKRMIVGMRAQMISMVDMRLKQMWQQLQKAYSKKKGSTKGGGIFHYSRIDLFFGRYQYPPYHYAEYNQ